MSKNSYVLVVNLKSRQAVDLVEDIEQQFEDKGLTLRRTYRVKNPKKLSSSFKDALRLKPDVLVLAGGDGTLIHGIELAVKADFKGKIGILPMGTANYLARDLSVPLSISEAIDVIKKGKTRQIPLGEANGKYFALMLMIGLTERVSANVKDRHKRRFGQLAYIAEGLKHANHRNSFRYEITSPKLKKAYIGRTHQIVVYNADMNQQLKIVPDHDIDKPMLKLVVYNTGQSVLRLFYGVLAHIVTFGHARPYMRTLEANRFIIETTPKRHLDYDGETENSTPAQISLAKHTAKILSPPLPKQR